MRNQILFTILFLIPGILSAQSRTYAGDPFDELVKEKKEIFGSEKEEKYPVRALIVDIEKWKGHFAWHVFWFIRSTDYPKFKQFRIFPFYNSIEAKSGKAELTYLFPAFGYKRVEAEGVEEKFFLSPFYYQNTIQPANGGVGYKESTNFYWLGYNSSSSGPGFEKSFSMVPGFFPLFTRSVELTNGLKRTDTMVLPVYFNTESAEESSTILTLFRWGHDTEKKFFNFFPLLHYTNYKTREDYSFTFFPLYHQSKSSISSRKSATYSPLWFYNEEQTSNSYSSSLFLPFPFLYRSKTISFQEESTSLLLAPLALYFREDGEHSKFRNFLIFQWGSEKDWSYFRILPLIYLSGTKNQSDRLFTFFPFVFYKENSHLTLFPLVFYKKDSYFTFFPFYHHSYEGENFTQYFLPFVYRSRGKENAETLILNTYWSSNKDDLTSFHFVPFWFYKKKEYTHLVPFVFSWKDEDGGENLGGPLYYRYRSKNVFGDYYLNTYYKRERGKGMTELISFPILFYKQDSHLTILPIYHHSIESDDFTQYFLLPIPIYRHIRKMESETLVLNTYWARDAKGEYLSSTFFPFYFHKKDSYLHIPFALFFQTQDAAYKETFAPFYYRYSSMSEDEIFFLGYHDYNSDNRSFRRLYPFYYSSKEKSGASFLGLAGLFYQWKSASAETTARRIIPLHYYQKNEYNLWLPFYYRFGGDDDNYFSFSPIHFRLRSPNVDWDWVFLLYYSSEDREEKTSSRFLAPLYFEWKNKESRGDILFPAYLKYYEKNKNLELYFGGISISQTGGRFDASLKASESGKEFYVDLDYSFVYNVFSVSLRKEVSNPLTFFTDEKREESVPVAPQAQNEKKTIPKKEIPLASSETQNASTSSSNFSSYKKLARGNSRNYFGWEALFGIASYQSGDDKKHFRILPLGWFTWGKNNDDRIVMFPLPLPTFLGTVGDESYRVVFPLYAEQRKGEDYTKAFGIFLFVMEKEKDRMEYSILWPLIHYAKSKEEISYRFFPIFAHREAADRLETKSIFYYRSKEKTGVYESSSFHGILFPFYHASKETFTKGDSVSGGGYSLFFPFYYRNYQDKSAGGISVFKERNLYTPLLLYSSKEDSLLDSKDSFVLSPFFYSSYDKNKIFNKSYISDFNLILPIPFAFWGQEGEEKYKFVLGYYDSNTPEKSSWNVLMLFGSSVTKRETKEERFSYVFPFFFRTEVLEKGIVNSTSMTLPIPFLFSTYRNSKELDTVKGGLKETNGWDWLFFANYEKRQYPNIQKTESDFKILFGAIGGYSSGKEPQKETFSWNLSLFLFRKSVFEKGVKTYSSTLIPVVFSNEETPDSSETTFFLIASSKTNSSTGFKRTMFLPFLYNKEERIRPGYTDSFLFVSFLFFQSKSIQEENGGNRSVDRFYTFPLLYTFENRIQENKIKKEVWGYDWLFFANYKNTKYLNTESTSLKLLLSTFGYETSGSREEHETSWYLFPLFFYKSEDHKEYESYRWFTPIVAYRSYNESQDKIRSHTNLFGILLNYKRDDENGTKSFFLFPSIYWSKDARSKESIFFFLPLIYNFSSEEESQFFLMGYYQRGNSVSNRYNFLYLYDYEFYLKEQKKELILFLGAFSAEFEKDRTRWGVLGGVLLGYESTPQMTDWNFLWIRYLNSPQERIQNFLPIYRYGETQEGYSFLAPPLLTYHEKDSDGTLTLGGLGLFYYRNRSEFKKEESTKILGGLFYFSEKKAARGYQNHGVLGFPLIGGLLWNYEHEEETGFEKTSVLKFVFSRTTYKGKTWNSYFGISPSLWFDKNEDN
ncbi:LA_1737 family protein [Leptospira mayottensis]|uniref:Uncharacterized protein n=2 Tax=Leptospira mayottensis TaxID=1137606 RepID=A0AA87MN81_9LEPT|nr:hypothetical protein [Leptospira mayottensis]AXR66182.1 hypothetical protein DQM28_13690 [Leptospira mayottensis]EKS00192.1 hypothetical protein LEP1GSC125_2557 [Leptospira mayottensis 200901122]